MASITISCEGTEQNYALETASVTLGRGLESDIRLKDIKASRRHCQIVKAGAGFQLLDLSSGNGTFINGVQVKQQTLNPGDKIQIGSTTITFNAVDAAPAKPAAKTAATPAVKAATTQARTATAQLPAAVTKKITTRAEAVKPTTQAVAKAQTQALKKPGTQSIPKAGGDKTGTGVMKKTTQRAGAGHTSRAMGKVSATQKFHKEARKGKSNPIAMLLIGIGVVFVGVLGFIFMGGGGGGAEAEAAHERYQQVRDKAAAAESDHKYDEAIKLYKQALDMAGGAERYKTDVMSMKASIKGIEDAKKAMVELAARFAAYEKKLDGMKTEQARDLWKEGKDLMAVVEGSTVEWKPRLRQIIETLERTLDTEAQTSKREDFQVIRNEIVEKYKLANNKGEADYSGAVKAWKEYLTKPKADKAKTDQALQSITLNAKDEFGRIRSRAQRNAEKDKAAALADAEKQFPRFEATDVAEDFKKLIDELKK
jgi:pSer/pThr/pTyr-binding forkhead associated (FHA) protein